MMMEKGQDPDSIEELAEKYALEGTSEYEKFVNQKTRYDSKQLIIEAYEGVLQERRLFEKNILNGQRFKEYEKNRPP